VGGVQIFHVTGALSQHLEGISIPPKKNMYSKKYNFSAQVPENIGTFLSEGDMHYSAKSIQYEA